MIMQTLITFYAKISFMLLLSASHAPVPSSSVPPSLADWLTAGATVGLTLFTSVTLIVTVFLTKSERKRLRDEQKYADQVRLESEKNTVTSELITDFFSDNFMAHRVAVSTLRRKVESGSPPIAEIACGYWYPGRSFDRITVRSSVISMNINISKLTLDT